MTSAASPAVHAKIDPAVASAVRAGLASPRKHLPFWLFYDEEGSRLFERITELPEYYLTRTERAIFAANAAEIIAEAASDSRLRITELGAGSASKTCLLLAAAVDLQGTVLYEPVDVSASALRDAARRIEREIAGVTVTPRLMDYTNGLVFKPTNEGERRLVLYIGSSIGNFEPQESTRLLRRLRGTLDLGDAILLGADQAKDPRVLLAAYDDKTGVSAAFNRNMLVRLNRELGANFDLENFAHRAVWNRSESRIEMHLVSRIAQRVQLDAVDMTVHFAAGETIHTENSYKFGPSQVESLFAGAGFEQTAIWKDEQNWFSVCLGRTKKF